MAISKDISNQKFNTLTAIKIVGKDKNNRNIWLFKCDCGNDVRKTINGTKSSITSCGYNCKIKYPDYTGQTIGSLTAIEKLNTQTSGGNFEWKWLCKCGNLVVLDISSAKRRKNNCGFKCKLKHPDQIGKKFGKLIIKERIIKKNNLVYYICLCDCGKTTSVAHGDLFRKSKRSVKSCGCLSVEAGQKRCGPNNVRYIHGRSGDYEFYHRQSRNNRTWTRIIKNRDNHTCQICGFRNNKKQVAAHHLHSYYFNPKKRLILSNGITLCNHCHRIFHSLYGNKVNKIDFYDFLYKIKYNSDWSIEFYSYKLNHIINKIHEKFTKNC